MNISETINVGEIYTRSSRTISENKSAKVSSQGQKVFTEMQSKYKTGESLSSEDLSKLIKNMSDLNVTNGDINWLMGKVFKDTNSPAIQNLFTQKLQERSTMAQTISSVWRNMFETMQSIIRNIR